MSGQLIVKRSMDVLVAVAVLVATAPLLLLIAVAIRLTMGRPVLFRQIRPGYQGIPFTLVKFRTMPWRPDGGFVRPTEVKLPRVGRLLRKTSLDELPQLVSVLLGQMSLVGPRPLLMEYLDYYRPEHRRRHDVKPGITGLAQINGRQSLKFSKRLEMDVWYVDHWSLWLDLSILFRTFLRLFRADGIPEVAPLADIDDLGLTRGIRPQPHGCADI
jgi:lipopolysaccharide/colanic/teichoic acid biosynthesis glycosyltransferase